MELVRYFITSAEEGNVFTFICLSVCLFVRLSICEQSLFHELLPSVPNHQWKNEFNFGWPSLKSVAMATIFGIFQGKTDKPLYIHFYLTYKRGTCTIAKALC